MARDVAATLGYSRPNEAVLSHCKKAKSLKDLGTSNQRTQLDQQLKLIQESDVYRLTMRSKLDSAEAFQDWVVEEVLPSIRKTGSYGIAHQFEIPKTYAEALRLAADTQEALDEANLKIEQDKPKVEFAMAVRRMEGACSVGEFAKAIGTGQNRFFKKLREDKFLMINNQPYQEFIERGFFTVIEQVPYTDRDGKSHPAFKTLITGKGQVYFEKKYRGGLDKAA